VDLLYLAFIDLAAQNADTIHPFEVCEGLIRRGHSVTLLTPSFRPPLEPVGFQTVRTRAQRLPLVANALHYALAFPYLAQRTARGRVPDVVYARVHPPDWALVAALKRGFGVPFVAEVNDALAAEWRLGGLGRWKLALATTLSRRLLALADAVITVTEELRGVLLQEYDLRPDRVHVVPNGTNVDLFRPLDPADCRRRLGLPPDRPVVCFAGGLRTWHGVAQAVAMLPALRDRAPDALLLIVGDGPEREALAAQAAALGVSGQARFTGRVARARVPEHLGAADVCVAPWLPGRNTLTGLSPLKIFDYMACARPIVTTDVGGMTALVGGPRAGVVVPAEDPVALAAACGDLLDDQALRTELGANGRRAAEERYSWDRIAGQVDVICRSVL